MSMRGATAGLWRLAGLELMLLAGLLCGACAPPELPAGWPAALPQYPGSVLTRATVKLHKARGAAAARQELLIELRSIDDPRSVMQFYDTAARQAGFQSSVAMEYDAVNDSAGAAYMRDGQLLEVRAWDDDRRTGRGGSQGLSTQRVTKARLVLELPQG
jgi:hypothetical protein